MSVCQIWNMSVLTCCRTLSTFWLTCKLTRLSAFTGVFYMGHICLCIHTSIDKPWTRAGGPPKGWNTVFVFSELAFVSVAVLRWLSPVYCMCVGNRKKQCGKQEKRLRFLEESPVWIPTLTMSTIENVVLEGQVQDLTRVICNCNKCNTIQNIPILL